MNWTVWGSTKIGRKKFVENILENRINAYKKYVNSLRISDGACHVSFIYIFWKKIRPKCTKYSYGMPNRFFSKQLPNLSRFRPYLFFIFDHFRPYLAHHLFVETIRSRYMGRDKWRHQSTYTAIAMGSLLKKKKK